MKNDNPFADTDQPKIDAVLQELRKTPWGVQIDDWLKDHDIEIVLATKIDEDTGGFVAYPYDKITLNAGSSVTNMMFALVHEARHLWQARALAEFGTGDRLCLYGHFAANPFALYIFNRVVEADAFSYQHTFLVDYLTRVPGHRRVHLTDVNYKTFKALDCDQLNINVSDINMLMQHRKTAFDAFFESTKLMQGYDSSRRKVFVKDCVDALLLGNRGFFQNLTGGGPVPVLQEDMLEKMGASMCSELNSGNFLTNAAGRVDLKTSFTACFQKKDRVRLKRAMKLPGARQANRYARKDGRIERLISWKA